MTRGQRLRVWSMRSASTYIAISAAKLERVHASNAITGAVISATMSDVLQGKVWLESGALWRKIRTLLRRTSCLFSAKNTIGLACKISRQAAESNCNLLCFLRSGGRTSNHEWRENLTPIFLHLRPFRLQCDNKGPSKNSPSSVGVDGPRKRSIIPFGTDRGN